MRTYWRAHALMLVLLATGPVACSTSSSTQPSAPEFAADDRAGNGASPTGRTTPVAAQPDSAQRHACRPDDQLTAREIAQIRALYAAYLDAIAGDLRVIDKVNEEAREAAQAGASRAKIAAILARAVEAKRNIAAATKRLRAAVSDILHDDRLPCFAVPVEPAG